MRTPGLPSLALLALAVALPLAAVADPAPATAIAPIAPIAATPSFEVRDRGDSVEVIAHNVRATRTAILPVRSRLEIAIAPGPAARRVTPGDATVKLIELDSAAATRMLSVKLGFERPDVKVLARYAQAIQVGDDLHVIVPRKVPANGVVPVLPEPSFPPAVAAVVAKIDPPVPASLGPKPAPIATPDAKPDGPVAVKSDAALAALAGALAGKPDAKPDAPAVRGPTLPAPAAATTTHPLAAPAARPGTPLASGQPLKQILAPEVDDTWSKISLYGALGLAAIGGGIWMMRRRKSALPAHSTIEVIAQRSLGGKARIVWLSAGQREMIISVTPQQVRMLGQWRKIEAAAMPSAYGPSGARPDVRNDLMEKLIEKAHGRPSEPTEIDDDAVAPPDKDRSVERRTGQHAAVDRPLDKPLSPAVSGILRLRGRTAQIAAVSEEVATGDVVADELWAREILAATGARR